MKDDKSTVDRFRDEFVGILGSYNSHEAVWFDQVADQAKWDINQDKVEGTADYGIEIVSVSPEGQSKPTESAIVKLEVVKEFERRRMSS